MESNLLNPRSQLANLEAQFRSITERAEAVVEKIGEARLTQRPAPAKWSVGECLIHLVRTTEAYLPLWRNALAEARTSKRMASERQPLKMDCWGRVLVWFLEPPPKVRFPT